MATDRRLGRLLRFARNDIQGVALTRFVSKNIRRVWLSLIAVIVPFLFTGCPTPVEEPPVNPWNITHLTAFGRQAVWSPDGSLLIFGDDRVAHSGIYQWNLTDEPTTITTDFPAHNWDYVWSHSGTKVAFSAPGQPSDPNAGIWVVDVTDGTSQRIYNRGTTPTWVTGDTSLIIRIDQPVNENAGLFLLSLGSQTVRSLMSGGFKPVAAPSDGRFLFVDNEINGTLYISEIDGVTDMIGGNGVRDFFWAPTRNTVFSLINRLNVGTSITGTLVQVELATFHYDTLMTYCAQPAINNDGSKFAYMSEISGLWNGVWVKDIQSGGERVAGNATQPALSPDGALIAASLDKTGIAVWSK